MQQLAVGDDRHNLANWKDDDLVAFADRDATRSSGAYAPSSTIYERQIARQQNVIATTRFLSPTLSLVIGAAVAVASRSWLSQATAPWIM
ncbi:MAG TPA: hypothetical protein VMO26_23990 [Vicinamibacterales bacterium]|nr:hypothetical protein [Vicinamibacterales bacterium]